MVNRMCLALGMGILVLAGSGCSPVEVGPIQVVINAGEAVLPPPGLGLKGDLPPFGDLPPLEDLPPLSITQPFCDLPSEAELTERIQSVGGFDVSRFARISAVELTETRFVAVDGDFSFANSASIHLTPVGGEVFSLGEASAPEGFGDAIILVPTEKVQLLEIIRANDAAPSELCPLLELQFTMGALTVPEVQFQIFVVVDAFVELGVFPRR